MKTLNLTAVGLFCFLAVYGIDPQYGGYKSTLKATAPEYEYEYEYATVLSEITEAYLPGELILPFQSVSFARAEQDTSSSGLDSQTELGGLEREVSVGGGLLTLLLFSLGYCLKRYRSLTRKNKITV